MFRFGDPGGRIYGSASKMQTHWNIVNSTNATWSVAAGEGRLVGSALKVTHLNGNASLVKTLSSQPFWGIAFAIRINSAPSVAVGLITFYDAGSVQLGLELLTDLSLRFSTIVTGSVTPYGSLSSIPLTLNAWHHIEIQVNHAANTAAVRLNNVEVLTSSGPTKTTSNAFSNSISLHATHGVVGLIGAEAIWYYDDIIIYDAQTTDDNGLPDMHDWIGNCSLSWLPPSGAGSFSAWSGSDYTKLIDNDNTTFVSADTTGQTDSYTIPTNTFVNIKSVAIVGMARKTDSGSRLVEPLLYNGTSYFHASAWPLANDFYYHFSTWGSNPATTDPWNSISLSAYEIGQKV